MNSSRCTRLVATGLLALTGLLVIPLRADAVLGVGDTVFDPTMYATQLVQLSEEVSTVTNLAQTLARIGEAGIWRVGLAAEAEERYDRVDYREPTAIVIGGEGEGLRQLTRRSCDRLVSLPMTGRVASLNAAAAGAAILYEAFRQRGFASR